MMIRGEYSNWFSFSVVKKKPYEQENNEIEGKSNLGRAQFKSVRLRERLFLRRLTSPYFSGSCCPNSIAGH
jgi:hypothetical protein